MFIAAQIIAFLALIANVIAIQLKKKKQILFFWIFAAFLFTLSFIFLQAYSGAIACAIAGVQTTLSYFFEKRNKKFPFWLVIISIFVSLLAGFFTYQRPLDLLPIIAAIIYVYSIIQTQEKFIRQLTLLNLFIWIIYDFVIGAYVTSISAAIFVVSTIIAIFRYDLLQKK